jgi:trehalose 6-phosphate synthase
LSMPLVERRMRWEAMMAKLRASTIKDWFSDFIDALQQAHTANEKAVPPTDGDPVLWPLRALTSGAGTQMH